MAKCHDRATKCLVVPVAGNISDQGALEDEVDNILAANPDVLERLRAGDMKPIGFLVGQVMKATRGKADPKVVSGLIRSKAQGG